MSCLYILEIKLLLVASFANMFFQSVDCLFILFMVSFAVKKLTSLIGFHLFIFAFISAALGDWSKKPLVQFMSENVLPMFSSGSFAVSCLMCKSFSHSHHFCAQWVLYWSTRDSPTLPTLCCCWEETAFSPLHSLASIVKDQLSKGLWVYFWALYMVPVSLIFVPVPHCFDYCAFVVLSEVWEGYASCFVSTSPHPSKIALAILCLLYSKKFQVYVM